MGSYDPTLFCFGWIPPQTEQNSVYTIDSNGYKAIIGFTGQNTTIAAGTTASLATQLYVGPKDQNYLVTLAELDLTIDYGIFWWIAQPLFWLLTTISFELGYDHRYNYCSKRFYVLVNQETV